MAGGERCAEACHVDIDEADGGGREFASGGAGKAGKAAAPGAVILRLEKPAGVLQQDDGAALGFELWSSGFERRDGVCVQRLTRAGKAVGEDESVGCPARFGDRADLKA